MALSEVAIPYGVRDLRVTSFTDQSATALGDPLDLPYIRTLSFSEAEDFEELRGDDATVTTRGKGASVTWDLESGGINLDVYAAIMGGTITETGTTPATVRRYRKSKDDVRPYFQIEGQAISDSGGDFHAVLHRCRASSDTSLEMADGAFMTPGMSGTGLPSLIVANDGALYDLIHNETAVAPTGPSDVGWGGTQDDS